ncbi:MAG: hypothetical protein KF713_01955 [Turneriella sp.]|nr:hypothetical protein [Turneriella sp.]
MKRTCLLALLSLFALNCSGDLPLSDLINNTIELKLLGTYESNSPYDFGYGFVGSKPYKDDVITTTSIQNSSPSLTGTPNIVSYANSISFSDLKYYIDIAEVRLAEGQGKSSSQSISDYWSQFAITRQLMCSDYATADSRTLANCSDSNGITRLDAFFKGGFTYPAVDVATGNYNHLGIYFRRFATGPAALFNGDGSYSNGTQTTVGDVNTAKQLVTTTFDNRSIYGQDIETLLQNPYGQTATEPLMFPLQRKDLSLRVTNNAEPYVLEVRIFLKNLMMVHVFQATGDSTNTLSIDNQAKIYIGPADWNADHKFRADATFNTGEAGRQGGAVLMTARVYQKNNVGQVTLSGATVTTSNSSYYVLQPTGSTFTPTTTLPYAATAAQATTLTITNIPPGTYDVYHTCDVNYCTFNSTGGACDNLPGKDGFPETAALCTGTVTVTKGTNSPYAITGCAIGSCS